jgi:hypothetical protein
MRFKLAVGETGARGSNRYPSALRRSSPEITLCLGSPGSAATCSPITNQFSPFSALLIDTLPIRNRSNSFPVSECAHSNRHSSETPASAQFGAPNSDFASRTTRLEVPCLLPKLLCYSLLVTRVPPNGLRASAPARSHGCGVDLSLPCNVRTTGAFPHKFNSSTGLMSLAGLVLRDRPCNSSGFHSTESPVGTAGVKEKSCES